jgi:two-component system phosphate regulon sensor histidine kinase PhoR
LKPNQAHALEILAFMLVLFILSGLVFWLSYGVLEQNFQDHLFDTLEEQLDHLAEGELEEAEIWGQWQDELLFSILDDQGMTLYHNTLPEVNLENQNIHLEVMRARLAGEGQMRRPHSVFGGDYLFAARKITVYDSDYILRLAMDFSGGLALVRESWWLIGGMILILDLLVLGSLWFYRSRQNKQLRMLVNSAETYSKSGVYLPTAIPSTSSYAILSQSLNQMIRQLEDRFDTIDNQKLELEAILGGMEEEVVVLNPFLRIKRWNKAFEKMFAGKNLESAALGEIIPSRRLLDYVHTILSTETPQELTLDLQGSKEKIFHFRGGPLKTPGSTFPQGVILVIQDITQLTRLEQVRKDFVANVSHELKTPITSIKGYVENLIDAADAPTPMRQKFLEKINTNADRLDNIIDDLLSLSKLEEKGAWLKEKERCSVQDLFHKAIQNYEDRLKQNDLQVRIINKSDRIFLGYANPPYTSPKQPPLQRYQICHRGAFYRFWLDPGG